MSGPVLEIESLEKTYGSGAGAVRAIGDVSFAVEHGEFVSVVGPSGAGKTTLLKCIAGLLTPTSGAVRLNGRPVDGPPAEMAIVFQDYSRSLMPWLTVGANVELPLRHLGGPAVERRKRVHEAVDAVGLSAFIDKHPWQLSGGMQQRVAIARALAYRPEILLMDEPFASVDAQTRSDLEDLVLLLRHEFDITVLLVTHDVDESVYVADRVVALTASPTRVRAIVDVDLPRPRDQSLTKGLPEFARLRTEVYELIRRPPAEAPPHQA